MNEYFTILLHQKIMSVEEDKYAKNVKNVYKRKNSKKKWFAGLASVGHSNYFYDSRLV